jgi:major type 1 subunit fimbrin (pilin)
MPYLPLGAVAGITNATVPASHATFSFTLSGCTGPATTAAAYFSGGNINQNGRLSVPAGGATNVEVALLDEATNTTLNLAAGSGAQGATKVTINSSGATVLTYGAMYYIGAAAPTAGAINPQVYYAIDYR